MDNQFIDLGIRLAANKLFADYLLAKNCIQGLEPESYADLWIRLNISGSKEFTDKIFSSFIKIISEVSKSNGK